ncbi:hypothetical protein ACFC18_38220 [Streptomyces sp. NPDC056121]|uniref:hypothetical protein n=2 Tax=Streptomyces TaxID=1883 RepID=UPI0035E15DB2
MGGDAYQAKHMTFGAHRAAFTVVAVVAVAGLLTAVALALINKPDGDNSAGLAADSRSATPARSMPPRTSKSASSPSAPAVATGAAQGTSAKPTAAKKPASPTVEFAETNTYCSGWRSTPEGSEVLKARGCVRVTGHDAAFGVAVRNDSKDQVTASVLVQYLYGGDPKDCPLSRYPAAGIVINPGDIWYSSLANCSVPNLGTHQFQAVSTAVENPDGTTSMNNGRNVYSPTMSISSTGALTCRDMDDTWGTCAPFEYVSGS